MASEDMKLLVQAMGEQLKQQAALLEALHPKESSTSSYSTSFPAFDSTTEVWNDYKQRFHTFLTAHSIPPGKHSHIFLTNQSRVTYKLLDNLALQQSPPQAVHDLSLEEIEELMKTQFQPKSFVVRERFNFWHNVGRKPGETLQQLAARIRQDATMCDFANIKDPLDEAMRTRFVCSVENEAILKALFKKQDDQLTFAAALEIAMEVEDAAQVARETICATTTSPVVHAVRGDSGKNSIRTPAGKPKKAQAYTNHFPPGNCFRCGQANHRSQDCRHKTSVCHFCQKQGHIEPACLKKKHAWIHMVRKPKKPHRIGTVKVERLPQPTQLVRLGNVPITFEIDTGAADNFISKEQWKKLGRPVLQTVETTYESASSHQLPTIGSFHIDASTDTTSHSSLQFVVADVTSLNLLGRDAIHKLQISVDAALGQNKVKAIHNSLKPDQNLQQSCEQMCKEFPDLFTPELGKLKDFELEVKFKTDATPTFCRPRPVPLSMAEELTQTYELGIAQGKWKPVQFNASGTPVVPVRKGARSGHTSSGLRVCGDYSVSVNSLLDVPRHPLPLPEDLLRKLGGGHYFTKLDLADAYSQIPLGPVSQKKLALSTHKGVLLQMRLPQGISSAPAYFQEVMHQLTSDLSGVAVYLDDLLVTGTDATSHLENLRGLLQRLHEKGLRLRRDKCVFAQPSVEYLGHRISNAGVSKGSKADAVQNMPPPTDVSTLRSFLSSLQFYGKFLPDLATVTEPLHRLTRKGITWNWGSHEDAAFRKLKEVLSQDTVLAHFDPSLQLGVSCDASNVGLGAVLFHRYPDGSERPIMNASKTLTDTQRRYGQIQREALSIIFAIQKFHQFLYGREFILVTDHKPLLSLFGPDKPTPALAANRLARWALMLSQYNYTIEYRSTKSHGNADALSRLPAGSDPSFDKEERGDDCDTVLMIHTVGSQIQADDPTILRKQSSSDPMISTAMRYTREGWPAKLENHDSAAAFQKVAESLSISNGCLMYGARVVIPKKLQSKVLQLLHMGHFGMERMKQLARTAVYWPNINADIANLCKNCTNCAEHQNRPPKEPNHPWMMPEKPWSRLHLDHAINFMGSNWLVVMDSYSKYPCIQPTQSTSTRATTELLEETFAHFGYPHTLVTDNATTFTSTEFQQWCNDRGITHLTGAPYHPATNGTAERLVQTFKQALRKSDLPPRMALLEFLQQYRRMPLPTGYSPSELLNGRQIRTRIDTLLPTHAHMTQKKQTSPAPATSTKVSKSTGYQVGTPCYARYYGPRRDNEAKWIPATVTKIQGTRHFKVKVFPNGPVWRRHVEQLRPRQNSQENDDASSSYTNSSPDTDSALESSPAEDAAPSVRRSSRSRRPVLRYDSILNP